MALKFENLWVSLVTVTRSLWRPLRMIRACVCLSWRRVETLFIRVRNKFLVEAMPSFNIWFYECLWVYTTFDHMILITHLGRVMNKKKSPQLCKIVYYVQRILLVLSSFTLTKKKRKKKLPLSMEHLICLVWLTLVDLNERINSTCS